MKNINEHDKIENLMGMLDDSIISEYLARRETASVKRRRPIRAVLIAAAVAVLCAIPLAMALMLRDDTPTPPVVIEGEFNILSVDAITDENGFIAPEAVFFVTTENGSVEKLQNHLAIDPPIDYSIRDIEDGDFAIIPATDLPYNAIIKLSMVDGKKVVNSWAFQTREVLSVSGVFPADGTKNNTTSTVIEIEFSYASVYEITDFVTFNPPIEGSWEHVGKIWRFTPAKALDEDTDYTVIIAPGIRGDEQTITEEKVFTFGTYSSSEAAEINIKPQYATVDKISTYFPGDSITMAMYMNFHPAFDAETLYENISHVKIERYDSPDAFIALTQGIPMKAAETNNCSYTVAFNKTIDKLFTITLDETLESGYYRASLYSSDGNYICEWFIQVNPLSVYAVLTGYDLLVWTGDNANVPFTFMDKAFSTGRDGMTIVDMSSFKEFKGEFIKLGPVEQPLLIGIDSLELAYPRGYLYADKLNYRPSDTLNLFGYIPIESLPETASGEYTIVIGRDLDEFPVTVDENGTFTATYKLDRLTDGDSYATLKSDGHTIASVSFNIANYDYSNYAYEFILDKNRIAIGDDFDFAVKVTHLSGISASGKSVKAKILGKEYIEKADENGIAHFHIPASDISNGINNRSASYLNTKSVDSVGISVSTGTSVDGYSENEAYQSIFVLLKPYILETEITENSPNVTFKLYHSKIPDELFISSSNDLIDAPADDTLIISVYETARTRYISHYEYDPVTKKNYPVYNYESTTILWQSFSVETKSGAYTVDTSKIEMKKDEEDVTYSYYINATVSAPDGQTVKTYDRTFVNRTGVVSQSGISQNAFQYGQGIYNPILTDAYASFKYRLAAENRSKSSESRADVGDRFDLTLESFNGAPKDGGEVMLIIFDNGIIKTEIFSANDEMSFIFDEELFPYAAYTGAYYRDGVFHRMPFAVAGITADDRKAEITLKADKEEYAPRDTVTLEIKVTDENGNPLKDTTVNVSVVDSAVGELPNHNISSIKSYLSSNSKFQCYTFSSYRDYNLPITSGAWGGGNPIGRSLFVEAPYFGNAVTDSNGIAKITFTLPDNITEYSVTVHAANEDFYTGDLREKIHVTKDFFIQHITPGTIKSTDDFIICATGISETLDDVNAVFEIAELGRKIECAAASGGELSANFGKLPKGTYTVRISATSGGKSDSLEFKVPVTGNANTVEITQVLDTEKQSTLTPSTNPLKISVSTEARVRYEKYLSYIYSTNTDRLDNRVANSIAKIIDSSLLGGKLHSSSISYIYGENDMFAPLYNSEGDPVLTALIFRVSQAAKEHHLVNSILGDKIADIKPQTLTESAEMLLLGATLGRPVLSDLKYMASTIEDDDYIEMILCLGFVFSGDFDSARIMYEGSDKNPGNEGYAALRAMAAVYLDEQSAASQIDKLISESPNEYYLSLAVAAYMGNMCGVSNEIETVTVTYGDEVDTFSVKGLEKTEKTYVTNENTSFSFSNVSENAVVRYTGAFEPAALDEAQEIFTAGITKGEGGRMILQVKAIPPAPYFKGTVYIEIPDAFRLDIDNLPVNSSFSVKENNVTSIELSVSTLGYANDFIYNYEYEIPLLVRTEGNFEFEPIVIVTSDDNIYVSNGFTVDTVK